MITHRLDTLKTCNVILHLEGGELVDVIRGENMTLIDQRKRQLLDSLQSKAPIQ